MFTYGFSEASLMFGIIGALLFTALCKSIDLEKRMEKELAEKTLTLRERRSRENIAFFCNCSVILITIAIFLAFTYILTGYVFELLKMMNNASR